MTQLASNPDNFRDATKMVSPFPRTLATATLANFAAVRADRRRLAVTAEALARLRPQPLRFLQQLERGLTSRRQLLQDLQQLAARDRGERHYEICRHSLAAQQSPVEVHFDEAVNNAKQLAQPKKKAGKKTEGGK